MKSTMCNVEQSNTGQLLRMLHLVTDEKFIDFYNSIINRVPGCRHRYIVHQIDPYQPLKHIRQVCPFRKVDGSYFSSAAMRADLLDCDVLVVHSLTQQGARMIDAAPSSVRIVWSGWGADYYCFGPGGKRNLYSRETRQIASKIDFQRPGFNPITLARYLFKPVQRIYSKHSIMIPAIRKVEYFSAPLPNDYLLLKQWFGKCFSAKYIQLNYGNLEELFVGDCGSNGNDILVGNSASLTSNHVDVFRMLEKQDLNKRKVIVPLSYGNPAYRDVVLSYGNKMLGDNFHPIVDFIPLAEYNNLISSCACAIMNHYRQQALGNIGAVLFNGARLYLNKKNVTYEFFKKRGAHVYDIEEMNGVSEEVFSRITVEQRIKNVQVLKEMWGQDKVSENIYSFINSMRA